MGKLVEGLWDCQSCGRKGNPGGKRECEGCGSRRDENTRIYLPDQIHYVPQEEAEKINKNPDWLCEYCGSFNSDSDSVCSGCGSVRTSENLDYFSAKKKAKQNLEVSITDSNVGIAQNNDASIYSDINDQFIGDRDEETRIHDNIYDRTDGITENITASKLKSVFGTIRDFFGDYWKFMVIIVSILALIAGLVYLLIPKNEEVTITSFSWERSIAIERYQTVDENGWSLPEGARLHETRREIYTYEKVLDHYETKTRQVAKQRFSHYEEYVSGYRDLGNGHFEEITSKRPVYETYYVTETYQEPVYRQKPVYKTKYYYEIDKWLYDRTLRTRGNDKNPYWEDVSSLPEDERVANREEKYYINGINTKGKEKNISIPYENWQKFEEDQKVKLKVSVFGDGKVIE